MLTGFQIRVARAVLNLHIEEVSSAIGIHKSTLTRLELTPNLSFLSCNNKTSLLIKHFYEGKRINFPSFNTITMSTDDLHDNHSNELNRFQLKSSRTITRMSRTELGQIVQSTRSTIEGWEKQQENFSPIRCYSASKQAILNARNYFISIGILFPSPNTISLLEDPALTARNNI